MSKNTVTGIVTRVETTGHTFYGNPIKVVTIQLTEAKHPFVEGVQLDFRISDNASLAFEIGNGEFHDEPHTFALTRAGRISHRVR